MFPLYTKTFPKSAPELARLLSESIRRLVSTTSDPVSLRDRAYPEIAELRISLDGATLRAKLPPLPVSKGAASPAITLDALEIEGADIKAGSAQLALRLSAREVHLSQSRDENDHLLLQLKSARTGNIEVSASREVIESAIATMAKSEARKQGVTIDQVNLTIRSSGMRSLEAQVEVRGRKLFFSTIVRIAGKLDLDEELNATLSNVRCTGEGAIGSLACGFLAPHLQKVDGRTIALMALPLGELRLRDVTLSANERLTVRAEFGA